VYKNELNGRKEFDSSNIFVNKFLFVLCLYVLFIRNYGFEQVTTKMRHLLPGKMPPRRQKYAKNFNKFCMEVSSVINRS